MGHGAVIHGAILEENCLIGMNSVIMDDAQIGKNTIIGALSFVPAKELIPSDSLAVGNPVKVVKKLSQEQIQWKTKGTEYYQKLPKDCFDHLEQCEPLKEEEENRPIQDSDYSTWK